jgi:hypothetical protein
MLLVSVQPSHHHPPPPLITPSPVNHGSRITSTNFCNKIGQLRHFTSISAPTWTTKLDYFEPRPWHGIRRDGLKTGVVGKTNAWGPPPTPDFHPVRD